MKGASTFAVAVLLLCLRSVQAAPQKAAPPYRDPQVSAEVTRLTALYQGWGDFSISSIDILRNDGPTFFMRSTARFAADGRRVLKASGQRDTRKTDRFQSVKVFDGQELVESDDGRPEKRQLASLSGKGAARVDQMFSLSMGLTFIKEVLNLDNPRRLKHEGTGGPRIFRDLGAGRVQLEMRTLRKYNGAMSRHVSLVNIASDGYVESVQLRITTGGKQVFYGHSILSHPTALTSRDAFDWAVNAPPPDPKFFISPESRAALERAARLYGGLNSMSLGLKNRTVENLRGQRQTTDEEGELAWERRGLLRYFNSLTETALVVNGIASLKVDILGVERQPLPGKSKDTEVLRILARSSEEFGGAVGILVTLLRGEPPIVNELENYSQFKAWLGGEELLDGARCDVVEIRAVMLTGDNGDEEQRLTRKLWFAQSNGRLLRIVEEYPDWHGGVSSDARLESQRFDIGFAPSIWMLSEPEEKLKQW
jgi:hypothetical protein